MEPKVFEDLDNMEVWAQDHPDKVSRHLLRAWREVVEDGKQSVVVVRCSPEEYFEDMNIIVEEGEAEEALETLLQEAIDREDYEIARDITKLQDKLEKDS